MQQHDTKSIVTFAATVCIVCSVFVAGSAVVLKPLQERNKVLDRQKKVLAVAGLVEDGEKLDAETTAQRFAERIHAVVVDLASGTVDESADPSAFDQRKATKDPELSEPAPPNNAGIPRLPEQGLVYRIESDGKLDGLILPIEGKGLWSTLYGFIALDADGRTVKGITFYEHGETPGLGGEVDNPRWQHLWVGRLAFDDDWSPAIAVKKGRAGSVEADPYQVDGLSGATITSRGVTHLVQFWLGEHGFGPYLEHFRESHGIS